MMRPNIALGIRYRNNLKADAQQCEQEAYKYDNKDDACENGQ